jgi:hypothetical protein
MLCLYSLFLVLCAVYVVCGRVCSVSMLSLQDVLSVYCVNRG